jgi:L-fucose dehydrogenase
MDLQLANKVVLLAGDCKLVSAAIARALASESAIPVMGDGDANISAAQSQVENSTVVHNRSASPEHSKAAVEKTMEEFGRLDALVNHVAIVPGGGLEHLNVERYVDTLTCALLPCYTVTHYALPYLKRAGGSIVNVMLETAGANAGKVFGGASATGAILALTREWAAELAGSGIRVNAVLPSALAPSVTPQPRDQPERLKSVLAEPDQENGKTSASELAAMVVFLLSARATHITGQHMYVNGDHTASG